MKRFGVMLDCSRNAIMQPQEIKNFAKILKSFGYNMLQIYTEDTYEVENEPYFGYMRGRYTVAELQDIVAYCNSIDMEVIPCIQTLAHLETVFRWNEYQKINDYADILLVGEERTYTLIENMFKTIKKCFTSEYVHIGMDEAFMLGLGQYRKKHGVRDRFEILSEHLKKVVEIAKKYDLKPIMWSDMFFRLSNNGAYYPDEPRATENAKRSIPEGVGLVYWDYYHAEKEHYAKMLKAHAELSEEVWFAGGAWSWVGFAGGNARTLQTMFPAMEAVKEKRIDNIMLTLWGDNGKECSYYSLLPSLFAVKKYYDGERDMETIKREFQTLTGEDYDAMSALDKPNFVGGNQAVACNISKYMLYNDPFNGFFDSIVKENVGKEFEAIAAELRNCAQKSKNYGYIFENHAALCELLAIKYDLGCRTRIAYQAKDRRTLSLLVNEYDQAEVLLEKFYRAFEKLWYKENKPQGFDVQELRLGGLKLRLRSCKERLLAFVEGRIDDIPELEEELLCYYGGGKDFKKSPPSYNAWISTVTPNRMGR